MRNHFFYILVFAICFLPGTALGASTITENFNSYTSGLLNGLSGGENWTSPWTTDGDFFVQNTFVYEGSQAVGITTTNTESNALRTFEPLTKGKMHFAMGKNGTSHETSVIVQSDDTLVFLIVIGSDNQSERFWYIREGNTQYKIAPYDMGTYGTVDIQFNLEKQKYRASINGGKYTDWYGLVNPVTSVDTVRLHNSVTAGPATTEMYWDDIEIKGS